MNKMLKALRKKYSFLFDENVSRATKGRNKRRRNYKRKRGVFSVIRARQIQAMVDRRLNIKRVNWLNNLPQEIREQFD